MTKIEWADEVWNPVTGCSSVTQGCRNCYARRMAQRLKGRFGYPKDQPFSVTVHPDRFNQPFRWRKPRKIFVCSMGDLFHEDVQTWMVDEILEVISACPRHTFFMLTKRPENIESKLFEVTLDNPCRELGGGDYLRNLWLGVTAETQRRANERISLLLQIPGFKKFISIEPMLEPINIAKWLIEGATGTPGEIEYYQDFLSWVIVGGETGPGARPMNPEWARSIRDQCQSAGMPFFFKKMGSGISTPEDLMIREFPEP